MSQLLNVFIRAPFFTPCTPMDLIMKLLIRISKVKGLPIRAQCRITSIDAVCILAREFQSTTSNRVIQFL